MALSLRAREPARPNPEWRRAGLLSEHPDAAVAAALTALAGGVFLLPGLDGWLPRDPGVYVYGGQQVAEGIPPYVGVLNRAGPLAQLVPGLGVVGARLVGADDVAGVRVLFLLIAAVCVGVTYLLARHIFVSRRAGIIAALALVTMHDFARLAAAGPREKTLMVLLLVLALLAAARARWFVAGVMVALATLTWQPVFFAAFPGVLAMALLRRPAPNEPGRGLAVLRVLAGGLVPSALAVAAYAVVGQLRTALDAFLLINLRYTRQRPFLDDPASALSQVRDGFGWFSLAILLGIVAGLALAAARARGPGRHGPAGAAVVGLGMATLGGVLWTLRAFQEAPDAFVLLPLAAVGLGGLVAGQSRRLPSRAAVGLTLVVSTLLAVSAVGWGIGHGGSRGLDRQEALGSAVSAAVPDATVVSVNAPDAMAVLGARSLTRYQMFRAGFPAYYEDHLPGGLAGYRQHVADLRPDLVVIGSTYFTPAPWIRALAGRYEVAGEAFGWQFLASTGLPADRRRALADALLDATAEVQLEAADSSRPREAVGSPPGA